MARNPKFAVLQIDGEELETPSEYEALSEDIYYDVNKTETVFDKLDEVGASASPGFSFGRAANVGSGTWLQITGGVPSNKTGVPVAINNPELTLISVGNEKLSTFDVGIYEHEGGGVNMTLLTTVSLVSSRTDNFNVSINVSSGKQLAARITSGRGKNVGVSLQLKGSN